MTPKTNLTPRERFSAALERKPLSGRVPHFELVFFLTMETFGKVHPSHRDYAQWGQMREHERELHRNEMADIFIATAERFEHSAIFIHPNPDTEEERWRMVALIREKIGNKYFLLMHGYRDLSFYTIKHTDGNIMPILDQLVECNPHALHSLDPQGGVDIAEVKRRCGDRVCLIGNVNCGLLDTGTDAEVIESARYALTHGSPGGGYIFSTSNCVYPGMRLERYELLLNVWREFDYTSLQGA